MKAVFKPLAIATAVAAASVGYSGVASAEVANNGLGDLIMVPYYTVNGGWVTGVHITNTSSDTQVVKMRFRRAEDSLDVLDFNVVLSPYDEWTATVRGETGAVELVTTDKSCTVPVSLQATGQVTFPISTGSNEGYIEVIGMGAADVDSPIGRASKHINGVPLSCGDVSTNFFAAAVTSNSQTIQTSSTTDPQLIPLLNGPTDYVQTDNVLKVSYFLRDNDSGIEFGNNAVHIADFAPVPMMTHQQFGLESLTSQGAAALYGWDFPNINGAGSNVPYQGAYDAIIRPDLGAAAVLNDWSYNASTGAATDWVITIPGQYVMVDPRHYTNPTLALDYRDIPVIATFNLRDREETSGIPGGLNFSPSPAPDSTFLPNEVNVISWGPASIPPVLDSVNSIRVNPADAGIASATGWAWLSVTASPKSYVYPGDAVPTPLPQSVYDPISNTVTPVTNIPVPMTGFTAWQRTFDNPDKNYGRIIEHSFISSN